MSVTSSTDSGRFFIVVSISIVALIEDGATVKTFYREEGVIRLQPENDALEPIIVRDVQIMGKVIGVFRFL